MLRVKGFEPLGGLWWRKTYETEGWIGMELVGPDTAKYEAFNDAVCTIEKATGLPEQSLWKLIRQIRPDVAEKFWMQVYLRGAFRKDQVVEGDLA